MMKHASVKLQCFVVYEKCCNILYEFKNGQISEVLCVLTKFRNKVLILSFFQFLERTVAGNKGVFSSFNIWKSVCFPSLTQQAVTVV